VTVAVLFATILIGEYIIIAFSDLKHILDRARLFCLKFLLLFEQTRARLKSFTVRRPSFIVRTWQDVSALGMAYMAGLQQGVFKDVEHLAKLNIDKTAFNTDPQAVQEKAAAMHQGRTQAIEQLT